MIKLIIGLLNLNRIVAINNTENIVSGKVMIKNNMKYKVTLIKVGKLNGSFYDLNIYSILKSEWKS